jgi:L-lysine 6-transaminase
VKDNVFRLPVRISSTWGGNFTDYVRSTHFLRIIEEEELVENARAKGELFQAELHKLAGKHPFITAVRGRGLMLAFDLPDGAARDAFWKGAFDLGLLVLRCGDRSIRLRPVLDITEETIETAMRLMDKQCWRMK